MATPLNIYSYVADVDKDTMFHYLVYVIAITSLVVYVNPNPLIFSAIPIALALVLIVNDKKVSDVSNLNEVLRYRMISLNPSPKYFHLSVDAINFFYNIRDDVGLYHNKAFPDILIATDDLLHLLYDMRIGVTDCSNDIDVAKDLKDAALNHLNSIFLSIPIGHFTYGKLEEGIYNFQLVLTRIIDEMTDTCMKSIRDGGINARTRFPETYDGPKPNDDSHKIQFHEY